MNEITKNNEKLSAYLDDALSADQIESLLAEQEASDLAENNFSVASRYHIMGEALRGELSDAAMVDVSAQVRQALRHESMDVVESVKRVKAPKISQSRFSFSAWLESFARPLAGMAVAASVAVFMVVTVVQVDSPENGAQLASQSAPLQVPAATLVAENPAINTLSNEHDFDAYLAEHAEFAAQDTLQGRIPYVRAVSYEAE